MNKSNKEITSNPAVSFDRGYKWLHWSMAALIGLMFIAIQGFASVTTVEEHMTMLIGHSSIGSIICILLLIRVSKRFVKKNSRPVQNISRLQKLAANIIQSALYFCMAFVPITGYLTARMHELPVKAFAMINLSQSTSESYDQASFSMMRQIHEFGIYLFMALILIHISAALYHRVVKKDSVLSSMTFSKAS